MVRELMDKGEILYICEACGLAYKERMWAEKCEDFCNEHHACSLDIASHAIVNG
jgi:hypothetical protein